MTCSRKLNFDDFLLCTIVQDAHLLFLHDSFYAIWLKWFIRLYFSQVSMKWWEECSYPGTMRSDSSYSVLKGETRQECSKPTPCPSFNCLRPSTRSLLLCLPSLTYPFISFLFTSTTYIFHSLLFHLHLSYIFLLPFCLCLTSVLLPLYPHLDGSRRAALHLNQMSLPPNHPKTMWWVITNNSIVYLWL